MAGFFIEEVKCGAGEGGMACGPTAGPVVAEAKVRTESGEEFYLSLAEVDGIPNFFRTAESTYKMQLEMDEEFENYAGCYIPTGEYDEIFGNTEDEFWPLYRLMIAVIRLDWEECDELMKAAAGKWLDEIEVPVSDVEEMYLEDEEEDDGEDDEDDEDDSES